MEFGIWKVKLCAAPPPQVEFLPDFFLHHLLMELLDFTTEVTTGATSEEITKQTSIGTTDFTSGKY